MDHVRGVQFGHMNLRIKEVVLIVWMVWHGVKNAYCATKAILMGFGVPCYCGTVSSDIFFKILNGSVEYVKYV